MAIRCVIVDDSEDFRVSAERLLSVQGIVVVADVADGQQALRAVDEQDPDVVLVDAHLGEESGFDVAERIHGSPVIMISASLAPDEVHESMARTPAIGYLPKSHLSAQAIEDMLRRHEAHRSRT